MSSSSLRRSTATAIVAAGTLFLAGALPAFAQSATQSPAASGTDQQSGSQPQSGASQSGGQTTMPSGGGSSAGSTTDQSATTSGGASTSGQSSTQMGSKKSAGQSGARMQVSQRDLQRYVQALQAMGQDAPEIEQALQQGEVPEMSALNQVPQDAAKRAIQQSGLSDSQFRRITSALQRDQRAKQQFKQIAQRQGQSGGGAAPSASPAAGSTSGAAPSASPEAGSTSGAAPSASPATGSTSGAAPSASPESATSGAAPSASPK